MVKSFFVTRLEYGLVSIEVPEGATEQRKKALVIQAEQRGEASWHDSEITDITEVGIDS